MQKMFLKIERYIGRPKRKKKREKTVSNDKKTLTLLRKIMLKQKS